MSITSLGRITVDGEEPLSCRELYEVLRSRTSDSEQRRQDGWSQKALVIWADASVPWMVVQAVLRVAYEPRVTINRIFFGARERRTRDLGAIGIRLFTDRGMYRAHHLDDALSSGECPTFFVRLFAMRGRQESSPEALYAKLRGVLERIPEPECVAMELHTPNPNGVVVPTGFVIQTMDVAIRAGVTELRLASWSPPLAWESEQSDHIVRAVREVLASDLTPFIRAGDEVLGSLSPGSDSPPARGLLAEMYGTNIEKDLRPSSWWERDLPHTLPFSNIDEKVEVVEFK